MAARGLHILLGCLATAALLTPPAVAEGDQDCADGWTKFDSHCFKFFEEQKTWTEAEKSCHSLNGNLASIHSEDENTFVVGMIVEATGHLASTWLGGNDAVLEGTWMWSDGSAWDFTAWADSQPDNAGGNEHNMHINFNGPYWNDAPNSVTLPYICAKDVPHSALPEPKSVSLTLEGFLCQCSPQKK
ncbi:galactose-specific lectin nattectin-like [Boleophthalmus pectinirostris]|uniref:galactose-specific lectin nattectin-like n=1 Tax=Boleophthalmus pectinirostris TaxID=150288 RepID=UPI00242F2325|nr:galactose-specific lectin nattectin-like [Boleophthalmus pectinirostris]